MRSSLSITVYMRGDQRAARLSSKQSRAIVAPKRPKLDSSISEQRWSLPIVMQQLDNWRPSMQGDNPISWLMFFTLAATTFAIAGAFIYFLRSRTNRDIAARALEGDSSRAHAAPGAGVELIAVAAVALAVMGLLTAGYAGKSNVETAVAPTPVGQTTGMSQGMAQPAGSSNEPKRYQPANPAPDTRSAPTSTNAGVGNENGSTGQPK
jgi:hypothetical protein